MIQGKDPWFVTERSQAFAAWLLSAQPGVHIRSTEEDGDVADLLVELNSGDGLSTRLFVVQVKGTTLSDPAEAPIAHLFHVERALVNLPVCLFVVNVRDNSAAYAWIAEPRVEAGKARLAFHEQAEFQPLRTSEAAGIVRAVTAWYDVLPQQLTPLS